MKKYKLSEICFNITDGTHSTVIDDKQSNYFLLSCKNIKDGKINISKNDRKISIETLKSLRKRTKMELNDVVLTSVGTIGQSSYIRESNPPFEFQRSVAILKPNLNYVLSQYLHYYFISSIGQSNIQSRIKGAAQPCLFLNDIKTMEIMLPEFQVQQHIVDTIGSVDDLIELNEQKINKILNLSIFLFKTLKTEKCKLKDVLSFNKRGVSPLEGNKDIIVINQKCIRDNFIDYSEKGFHDNQKKYSNELLLKFGDVLVNSMGTGTLGRISIFIDNITAIPHSCVSLLRPNTHKIGIFTFFCLMKQYEDIITLMGEGSTGQTSLNNKLLGELEINCPVDFVKIEKNLETNFTTISNLRKKNHKLKRIKQILLQKYFG